MKSATTVFSFSNQTIVQAEQSGYIIPFVTAIVFLLNCVDFACKGLYDCEIIIDRLAGDVGVARDRCSKLPIFSNGWSWLLTVIHSIWVDKWAERLFRPFLDR